MVQVLLHYNLKKVQSSRYYKVSRKKANPNPKQTKLDLIIVKNNFSFFVKPGNKQNYLSYYKRT
jgi:hypothetical protein